MNNRKNGSISTKPAEYSSNSAPRSAWSPNYPADAERRRNFFAPRTQNHVSTQLCDTAFVGPRGFAFRALVITFLFIGAALTTSFAADQDTGQVSPDIKDAIVDIVRMSASNTGINADPLEKGVPPKYAKFESELKAWLTRHGESIVGTRGGPFKRTKNAKVDFVTTCKKNLVYLHILDWNGENNFILPNIRSVKNSWLLGDSPDTPSAAGLTRENEWGLCVLAPSESQVADTVVVLELEGDAEAMRQQWSPETEEFVCDLVRTAGANAGINANPLEKGVPPKYAKVEEEIKAWLARYGETIVGTRGGPFKADKQDKTKWVTTCKDDKIYLHVLDWGGGNQVSLPAISDRLVKSAYLLGDKREGEYPSARQTPWGLLAICPEIIQYMFPDTVFVMEIEGNVEELRLPRLVEADPSWTILLRGEPAALQGRLTHQKSADWIEGWSGPGDDATWKVSVPSEGEFEVALIYECAAGGIGSEVELNAGQSKITGVLKETRGWMTKDSLNFERIPLDGKLRLSAGANTITLTARKPATGARKTKEMMKLHAVELISPAAKQALAAAKERAKKKRASAEWLAKDKYGIMIHWMPSTWPRKGPQKPFEEAVADFNVNALADAAKECGASYFIFTSVHGIAWFPGPNKTFDRVLPGHTCKRDLIADMADAFEKRGIKLILYYHHGVGDTAWAKASGFYRKDKSQFFKNEYEVLSEIGQRYGKKVVGYWFDDRYPEQPFERLYEATKAGNPDRIVAWNSWILPRTTDFQEYYAGEAGNILALPDPSYFKEGGPAEGLTPQFLLFIDDPWHHGYPDKDIAAPLFKADKLVRYIKDINAIGGAVTFNLGVYQDGSISPASLELMKTVRKGIRGE